MRWNTKTSKKSRLSEHLSRKSVIVPDLEVRRSRATEFSWTSRFQNLKLYYLNSIEDAFRQNLTSGSRDIFIFVKKIRKIRHAFSARFTRRCTIKYCYKTALRSYPSLLATSQTVRLRLYKPIARKHGWRFTARIEFYNTTAVQIAYSNMTRGSKL